MLLLILILIPTTHYTLTCNITPEQRYHLELAEALAQTLTVTLILTDSHTAAGTHTDRDTHTLSSEIQIITTTYQG